MNRIKQAGCSHSNLLANIVTVITLMIFLVLPSQAQAQSQWTTNGNNINNTNTGNVGIGTSAPYNKLEVAGTGSAISFAPGPANGLGANAVLNRILGRSNFGAADGSSAAEIKFLTGRTNWYTGQIAFYTNGTDSTASVATERMRIDNDGNVGIGTTSPTAKLDVNGSINVSGNINAKYQDVAEWVPAAHPLPAGTVVVLNPNRSNQVMASAQAYDTRVAGVISEKPGLALGEAGRDKLLVATTGRVRVKVDASRAPIHVGDLLVTSDVEGMAMKSEPLNLGGVEIHRPGTLIGKALEPLGNGRGEILVLLSLQ